jgi:hypothetical protein
MNIKLFEEYSELYTEVDRNIFWDNYENVVTITDKEISKIRKLIPKCTMEGRDMLHINLYYAQKRADFYFYKNDDDWWWVNIDTITVIERVVKYYKCDQLEGFLKLLTDLIVKPKIGL